MKLNITNILCRCFKVTTNAAEQLEFKASKDVIGSQVSCCCSE